MKTQITLFFFTILSFTVCAQTTVKDSITRKKIKAIRIDKAIKIDGILDDEEWKDIPIAKDFIELRPNNGKPENPDFKSEVKIVCLQKKVYYCLRSVFVFQI